MTHNAQWGRGRGSNTANTATAHSDPLQDDFPALGDLSASGLPSKRARGNNNNNNNAGGHRGSAHAAVSASAAAQPSAWGPKAPPGGALAPPPTSAGQQPSAPASKPSATTTPIVGTTTAAGDAATTKSAPAKPRVAPKAPEVLALKDDERSLFDAYIVLDFEATCEKEKTIDFAQEIIEFPMVIVDPDSLTIVSEFQRYVRPELSGPLTPFCTELTGITQATVDAAQPFRVVYDEAIAWLKSADLLGDKKKNVCVVTCGDWDLKTMLPTQLRHFAPETLPSPQVFKQWMNVKSMFEYETGSRPGGMPSMLKQAGLPLIGKHHSGIDDCRNIASILLYLLKYNNRLGFTSYRSRDPRTRPLLASKAEPVWPVPSLAAGAAPSSPGDAAPAAASPAGAGEQNAALQALLSTPALEPPMERRERDGHSRKLTMILRHRAADFKLTMTANGLVKLDDVMKLDSFRNRLDLNTLGIIIRDCPKQRVRVVFGKDGKTLYVGANQGHSIEGIDADLKPIKSVEECPVAVHGTYLEAWPKIRASGGLSPMGREHVHFAKGLPGSAQVISGMRRDVQVLMYLDVAAALRDHVPLLESANGVILSGGVGTPPVVPLKYFTKVVDAKNGASLL